MSAILTSIPPYFSRLREFAKKAIPLQDVCCLRPDGCTCHSITAQLH